MRLRIGDTVVEVTRPSPDASWRAPIACPVCGLTPIRVRAYEVRETESGPVAPAWCAGIHEHPIGELVDDPRPDVLLFMGMPGFEETFRGRIYGT